VTKFDMVTREGRFSRGHPRPHPKAGPQHSQNIWDPTNQRP